MIWFYFIFVSNLVLFLFKSIFFKSLPFLIYFFKFLPNYFSWLWILLCYFFRLDFYVVIQSHDTRYKILKVGFNHFSFFFKFHPPPSSSLEIGILCFFWFWIHLLIWFFLQFYPSIQDFCLSSHFIFSNEAFILLISISLSFNFFISSFNISIIGIWSLRFFSIVYKPCLGVHQGQWSGHGSSGLTRVNLTQPNQILLFYIKKSKWYHFEKKEK